MMEVIEMEYKPKVCINNKAAENQLTNGKKYDARPVVKWGNRHFYQVKANDLEETGLYEINRFCACAIDSTEPPSETAAV